MTNRLTIHDHHHQEERDFFFEMQKYAMHLRTDFVARQTAIADLYRMTLDLPGSVMELGIRNGATFFYLARLMEIFGPASRKTPLYSDRHLYGFDTFSGFPRVVAEDRCAGEWPEMRQGGVSTASKRQFFDDLERFKADSPEGDRIHVIAGDVCETIPDLVRTTPGLVLSLLYLDLDLYQPTLTCLEHLYPLVVKGGVVVFDEYGYTEFPGETKAVNEYFQDQNIRLRRFPWAYCPSAYFIKE
jgi:hypothetical protein